MSELTEYQGSLNRGSELEKKWTELAKGVGELISAKSAIGPGSSKDTLGKSSSQDTLQMNLPDDFKGISEGFTYIDPKLDLPIHAVEPLLNEAASHLERAQRDRDAYSDLGVRYLQTLLEVQEFVELDAITVKEVDAGKLKLPWLEQDRTYMGHTANREALELEVRRLDSATHNMGQLSSDKIVTESNYLPADNGARPAFVWGGLAQQFHAVTRQSIAALQLGTGSNGASGQAAITERMRTVHATLEGLALDRIRVARNYQTLRARLLVNKNNVFNYSERMATCRTRFRADLIDAICRLRAASKGQNEVFGFKDDFNPDATFDEIVLWTRDAISRVNALARRDQSVVVSVSLANLMGADFQKQLATGHLEFTMSESTFSGAKLVRLRSIGTVVESDAANGVFHLKVTPPGCKPHLIGRAQTRACGVEVEMLTSSSLLNRTPIGQWVCEITPPSTGTNIGDVQIELSIAYQM